MLAALEKVGELVCEQARLINKLTTAAVEAGVFFDHSVFVCRGEDILGELKVMEKHITRAHRRVTDGECVLDCLSCAQAGLRKSATIYRDEAEEYHAGLRVDAECARELCKSDVGATTSLGSIDEVNRLAMRVTERGSHLLHCIKALSTAQSLRNMSHVCKEFRFVMLRYAQSGKEMVLGREGEDLVPNLIAVLQAVLVDGGLAKLMKPPNAALEADKVEGGGSLCCKTTKGCFHLRRHPDRANNNRKRHIL